MPIIAKGKTGTRHLPSAGVHNAVCCDVHDLGYEETPWGDKHKVLVVWEIDEEYPGEGGGPFRVNKKYTNSLHEKANLCQDLESWRGKSFTKKQRKEGIDLEKLIGTPAMLNVIHNETDHGTWANVKAVLPLPKDQTPLEISEGYVRLQDRTEEGESSNGTGDNFGAEKDEFDPSLYEDDDDLPF